MEESLSKMVMVDFARSTRSWIRVEINCVAVSEQTFERAQTQPSVYFCFALVQSASEPFT